MQTEQKTDHGNKNQSDGGFAGDQSGFSAEENNSHPDFQGEQHLSRELTTRSVILIVISGCIGSAIFMGSGTALLKTGPSVLLSYALAGIISFFMLRIMGEMLLSNLKATSFRDIVEEHLGNYAGVIVGWAYWSFWFATCVQDLIAVRGYVQMWFPDFPVWVLLVVILLTFILFNIFAVKIFGRIESVFSVLKIVAIAFIVLVGLYLLVTHAILPSGHTVEVSNIFNQGPFFSNGLAGFFGGTQLALVSFNGIELVGVTSAEAINPKKTLPRAINVLPFIVMAMYVLSMATIICIIPISEIANVATPFAVVLSTVGIVGSSVILTVILTLSSISAANAGIYSASRMVYGMANRAKAPRIFSKLSKQHMPVNATLLMFFVVLPAAFIVITCLDETSAFVLASTWAVSQYFVMFIFVSIAYIKFCVKSDEHKKSEFKAPGGIVTAVLMILLLAGFLFTFSINPDSQRGLILSLVNVGFVVFAYTAYVIYRKKKYGYVPNTIEPKKPKSAEIKK